MYRRFIMHHIVTSKRLGNFQESNVFVSLKQITFKVGHKLYQSQSAKKNSRKCFLPHGTFLMKRALSPLFRTPIKGNRKASISKQVRRVKAFSFQTFLCGVGAGVYQFWTVFWFSLLYFIPLYYYVRNFCNLIGWEQWYFSLILNTYMWKLQTFCG